MGCKQPVLLMEGDDRSALCSGVIVVTGTDALNPCVTKKVRMVFQVQTEIVKCVVYE
jgi:hypothetical protein